MFDWDEETYAELDREYAGICRECGSVRANVEPDAEGYPCDECGAAASVIGALVYLEEASQ